MDQALRPGGYDQCHACRRPISEDDKASPLYQKGVSCPRCYHESSAEQKARFAERQKQIELARQRGPVIWVSISTLMPTRHQTEPAC